MTVQFRNVPGFADLPIAQAEQIIYEEMVPALELRNVMLSAYGNHNSERTLTSVAEYQDLKRDHKLFNIPRIQKVCSDFQAMMRIYSQYQEGTSYGLKHDVERYQKEYIANGDFIAAMLVNGLSARFAKRGEPLNVNCQFKARVIHKT